MKKILFLTLTLAMVLGLVFMTNGVIAEEEECPAAPDVAGQLLEDTGISARYGQGRDGGNYISDVARHMGPRTDFEETDKCDNKEEYRLEVAKFLIDHEEMDDEDRKKIEALFQVELESVIYKGTCDKFGSHVGDIMTFTFSKDIFHEPNVEVRFKTATRLWEGWGADKWIIDGNTATVTLKRLYGIPRDIIGDKVISIQGIVDVVGNDVIVSENGVEVTAGEIEGHGVLDPDISGTKFIDNGEGVGTLTTTLVDICGSPILPEDFPIVPPTTTRDEDQYPDSFRNYFRANAESKDNDYFYYIGASHFPADEGFTRATHEGSGKYTHTITKPFGYNDVWEIGIGPWLYREDVYVIQNDVNIEIACAMGIDPDASGATWEDNQDGTGTMFITVKDYCGDGVEGLGMDDIAIWPPAGNWRTLNELHSYRSWEVDFNEEGEGDYTALLDLVDEEQIPFEQNWDIQARDEKIEDNLNLSITDVELVLVEECEYNPKNRENDWPYFNWEIDGKEIEMKFFNPTAWSFAFDYQVDGEPEGWEDTWTGNIISGTRFDGEEYGLRYKSVVLAPGVDEAVTVTVEEEVRIRMRRGGETDWYLGWTIFELQEK